MCTDPVSEVILDDANRSSDFWFLADCQCPEKILKELKKLDRTKGALKDCQKLLLEYSKILDEEMTAMQVKDSFDEFRKDLAQVIGEHCAKYKERLNFGQALSEATVLLVVLHYAPADALNFDDGTCDWDKMPLDNNCLEWLLHALPKALHEEATRGCGDFAHDTLEQIVERVTMVDMRPIIPFSKKKCMSEFTTVRNALGLTPGQFDLIGHLLVAYHAKYFKALKEDKDEPLPILAGSYEVNGRMYNDSGQVTSSAVRKEGCICHPECWLAGYIGNSIIYSIDDYEEFGRALSRAFGHVAKVVEGLQVPAESCIGLRYGGLEESCARSCARCEPGSGESERGPPRCTQSACTTVKITTKPWRQLERSSVKNTPTYSKAHSTAGPRRAR